MCCMFLRNERTFFVEKLEQSGGAFIMREKFYEKDLFWG